MGDKDTISGKTEIYAIIGNPVTHSLSPLIHNSAFQHQNLDKVYIALPAGVEQLALATEMVRSFHIKGLNVTMPLKEAILPYLDKLSPEAASIGAVNCVKNSGGFLTGYNTDSTGFGLSIQENRGAYPSSAFLFGAGGAAKAIAVHLVLQGIDRLYITNRNVQRAGALGAQLLALGQTKVQVLPWDTATWAPYFCQCELVINATALGMKRVGDLGALLPWASLAKGTIIYETVYEPLCTSLMKQAGDLGFTVIPGTELLLYQAADAYQIWTGGTAPLAVMRQAMEKAFRR